MRLLNEHAQLFAAAAFLLLVGCICLVYALEFWLRAIDRICRLVGVFGAIQSWIASRENSRRWWVRCALWYERAFRSER